MKRKIKKSRDFGKVMKSEEELSFDEISTFDFLSGF